jgi:GNAT superfamily N-acetyltransferase
MSDVRYEVEPKVPDAALDELFASAWDGARPRASGALLAQSLTYIGAFDGARLVGFVNVAWDGGIHGFILDTTVHRAYQRRGIGTKLMRKAAEVSRHRGIEWLHVDFEPRWEKFYRGCGYRPTEAGLLQLSESDT